MIIILSILLGIFALASIILYKERARLLAENKQLSSRCLELEKSQSFMESKQNTLIQENAGLLQLKNEYSNLQKSYYDIKARYETLDKMFGQYKENISAMNAKLMQENRAITMEESKQNLSVLIEPLKNDIKVFKEKIESIHKDDSEARTILKTTIEEKIRGLFEETKNIASQANNLTNALKGNTKTQGAWGEMILEEILKSAGLVEGLHYILQGSGEKLRNEDDKLQKPDVLINLPDDKDKKMIIDSKVSLTNYERFCELNDEQELVRFLKSLDDHVANLSGKKYEMNDKIITPDYTIMFMPIEGAYSLAVQSNREIFKKAWDKGVIITCPSTLFGILRTIGSLWKMAKQNKNSADIARLGGQIYGKIFGILEDIENLQKNFNQIGKNFEAIKTKISGKGGVVSISEQMKEKGVKVAKEIPKEILLDEGDEFLLDKEEI